MIFLENVQKHFQSSRAVADISLHIHPGELVALIGPSGCGKSTLLRLINGLETLDHGQIRVGKTQLESPAQIGAREHLKRAQRIRQDVGMVFQSFNLFPHLTVLENLVKPQMVVRRILRAEAEAIAIQLLDKVGLRDKALQHPGRLSGGQQQRAAIARALAMSPKVLLYDEPTSALDPSLVQEVLQVMKRLYDEGMTQVVVTHEMRFAREVADRIVFLDQGQVIEVAKADQFFTQPQNPRTQQFLGALL